jgi:hypothetical protein
MKLSALFERSNSRARLVDITRLQVAKFASYVCFGDLTSFSGAKSISDACSVD